jgi:hypothetical protein
MDCVGASVPPIPGAKGTPLDKTDAATALAEQRAGALAKNRCAASWRDFYADVRASLGGK